MAAENGSKGFPELPASYFGIVLGIAGLSNAWRAAHDAWGLPKLAADVIFVAAAAIWLVVGVLYGLKWVLARDTAIAEAEHPVQCCFVGLAGVSTLLIAQGFVSTSRPLAVALFVLGAAFTLSFALWRTGLLWRGGRSAASTTPVLYLPLVAGGFVTGTVAAALGWLEWGQLSFGAALFTWLAVESVLLVRLYTGEPMPPALRPTLGIQLAPPAVGAVCYLAVGSGSPDVFAHAMLGYGLLQALLLLRMARWIAEQPFGPSYWAFTFGTTALAAALVRLTPSDGAGAIAALSPVAFLAANVVVLGVGLGTVVLMVRGDLLPPSGGTTPTASTEVMRSGRSPSVGA
jgi:tellurite resistance protein